MHTFVAAIRIVSLSWAGVVCLAAGPADFAVSSGEQTFRLSSAKGSYVALHFLLKTECDSCARHVAEHARRAAELAGVRHVFLKPDDEAAVKRWSDALREQGVAATIYRDADAKLAAEYQIPDGYAFHGETVRYPALVLLGPDGQEVFRRVGKDNMDRVSFDQLAAKVSGLSRPTAVDQYNLGDGGLALAGHDPVSYFEGGKPMAGRKELVSRYRGVVYQFASAENRLKFAEQPAKFVPAYGGWCATAMAEGRKVEVDPYNFKISDGRLLLFYKGWRGNALADWNKDEKELTTRADAAWRKLAPTDRTEKH
jgi:peroxiredoxin Q/BCP